MATWVIESDQKRQQDAIDKWGEAEWARRMVVVEQKMDELEKADGWEARCIIGNQFEQLARVMPQEQWDDFAQRPVGFWRRLVEKLILG